jgi:copper transport protein
VLVVLILAVAAGWRFTPPPRTFVNDAEYIHFHSETMMADLTLMPGRAGRSEGEMMIRDGEYRPLAPKGVTLVFSQPEAGIEPVRRDATDAGDNIWRIEGVLLPVAGRWRMRVEILVDDFTKVALEDDVLIRR